LTDGSGPSTTSTVADSRGESGAATVEAQQADLTRAGVDGAAGAAVEREVVDDQAAVGGDRGDVGAGALAEAQGLATLRGVGAASKSMRPQPPTMSSNRVVDSRRTILKSARRAVALIEAPMWSAVGFSGSGEVFGTIGPWFGGFASSCLGR
jgi:hypothetical protein